MLVLERSAGQKVVLGDEIVTIQVIQIKDNRVKLGFSATKDITIHRQEIFDKIKRKRELARKNKDAVSEQNTSS